MEQKITPDIAKAILKAQKQVNSGKLTDAKIACRKILKKIPNQPDTLHLLGRIALSNREYDQVRKCYQQALKSYPEHPVYHYNIGIAYIFTEQYDSAITHLKYAYQLEPGIESVLSDLCFALERSGQYESAIEVGKKAILKNPSNANAHFHLALAYHGWKNFELSFEHHLRASKLSPDNPDILNELGNAYAGRNEIEMAKQCYNNVLQIEPAHTLALCSLVKHTKYKSVENDDVHQLQKLEKSESLTDSERIPIIFSLAKVFQDCKLYDEAFRYFRTGNTLQKEFHPFSSTEFTDYISSIIKFHTKDLFSKKCLLGNTEKSPVIIVGTPRSGTTLVEQILSSHHDVFGAGELTWVGSAASSLQGYLKSSKPYPACTQELDKKNIDELSEKYLRYLYSLAGKESRVTDKMPNNFLHIGLIHILFPNVRIIHCRRDPKDACASMYCQYFPGGHSISHDLFKLGIYYQQYQRLMHHWKTALPSSTMIKINYEDLVTDQEKESKRLVKFIGLEWDEKCLDFHKKKRLVYTASSQQVTKPVYTSSIGRWKRYEKHLQPFVDGLNYSGNN